MPVLVVPTNAGYPDHSGLLSIGVQQYDAVIVGAGFGGIGAAIQLRRLGYDNILIVDREDDLGGTWRVNDYPGLSVDQPSTTYSYWFEPNPYWSRLFAPGREVEPMPSMSRTSTTSAVTCGSTPRSTAPSGTRRRRSGGWGWPAVTP